MQKMFAGSGKILPLPDQFQGTVQLNITAQSQIFGQYSQIYVEHHHQHLEHSNKFMVRINSKYLEHSSN